MDGTRRKFPMAGGALLAAAILAGSFGGAAMGEASIGFLAGLAAGLVLLGLVYLIDRR